MKKILLLATAGIASSISYAANIETTIITATRTEQSIEKTLAPSTVLDRETIELLQADDIYDLLSHIPGLTLSRNGGIGSNTSLFIRGTNSNHALVLINGQRMGSATLGAASIQHLSPEQIEKIEVIRGPRASLYGADAIGGVINIITTTQKKENKGLIKLSYGSNDTSEVTLGIDYSIGGSHSSWGTINIAAGVNYLEINGFDRTETKTGANSDDDEYDNTGQDINIEYSYLDKMTIGISHINNSGETEYDNSCTNSTTYASAECEPFTDYEIETSILYANIKPIDMLNIQSSISRTVDSTEVSDHLVDDTSTIFGGDSFFETERTAASLQTDVNLTESHIVTVGFDYYKDEVDSLIRTTDASTFLPIIAPHTDANGNTIDSLDNKAVFIQYQADFDFISFTTSLREDDHEAYGKNTTGNISIGVPILSQYKFIASYGTAFKAPTFNDLYWPDPYGPGNPNLKPEESRNIELGFQGNYDIMDWQVNIFRNEITDLIQWQPIPGSPVFAWSPFNVNEVEIKGAELSTTANISDWVLSSAYTYIETEDKSTGLELLRRPKQTFSFNLDKNIGDWDLGASLLTHSSRFDDVTNTTEYGSYSTTNLRFGYQPWGFVKFQFKISNLFDKQYTLASDFTGKYATEGRTAMLSVIFTPKF